ncbi:MAG: hypothetical protein QOF90_2593 [Acetobacteraceae bacterium]|jgi:hypothetical protein|nr:hypothetical protein [Acetobacteraceae bacterium]MEA2777187.1 hypothetical protein [Acetobacteraceae bacterium]
MMPLLYPRHRLDYTRAAAGTITAPPRDAVTT